MSVLFVCTGNSCRSQMAEAIVNAHVGDRWRAFSAGTRPAGYVHPLALRALLEAGISASGLRSKPIDEFRDVSIDLVVTVCDRASEECPQWLGSGKKIHRSFPDPSKVQDSEAAMMAAFRSVREAMERELLSLLKDFEASAH